MLAFFLPPQVNHSHDFFCFFENNERIKVWERIQSEHSIVRFKRHIQYLVSGKFLAHVYVLIDGFSYREPPH